MGAESEREYIYVCMNESSCSTPKTNTTYCKSTILQYKIDIKFKKMMRNKHKELHALKVTVLKPSFDAW